MFNSILHCVVQTEIFPPLAFPPDLPLFDALNIFQTGGAHIAVVTEQFEELDVCLKRGMAPAADIRILGIVYVESIVPTVIYGVFMSCLLS